MRDPVMMVSLNYCTALSQHEYRECSSHTLTREAREICLNGGVFESPTLSL